MPVATVVLFAELVPSALTAPVGAALVVVAKVLAAGAATPASVREAVDRGLVCNRNLDLFAA